MEKEKSTWQQKVAMTAAEILPAIIGQTPIIGDSAQKILNTLGYEQGIADSYLNSILRNFSDRVDKAFNQDAIGLDGGLAYSKSGTAKSNFMVSRAIAAYLHSIIDPAQIPMNLRAIVIALLHERMWQCRDSKALHDWYSVLPLYDGIREITTRLSLIVSIAVEIRDGVIVALGRFEPSAELFKLANNGISVREYADHIRNNDIFDDHSHSECISLSTCPMLLIEKYVDLFTCSGNEKFHYIPYPKPQEKPNKFKPPMLKSAHIVDSASVSPGLAVENIVQIKPFPFLNMEAAKNDSSVWPYGEEIENGYINLNPPFQLWCDHAGLKIPDWVNNRLPDVVIVNKRGVTTQDWDEYVEENSKASKLSFE